jgi:hypothetical protein
MWQLPQYWWWALRFGVAAETDHALFNNEVQFSVGKAFLVNHVRRCSHGVLAQCSGNGSGFRPRLRTTRSIVVLAVPGDQIIKVGVTNREALWRRGVYGLLESLQERWRVLLTAIASFWFSFWLGFHN